MNVLLDLGARLVVGHRGTAAHVPENTIESFRRAIALGADAVEFDVRVSSDGVPVVIHDASLLRTTGRSALVASLPASEIARADAGATFSPDGRSRPFLGRGLTVPTLASVLEELRGVPKIIEVKVPEAVEATRRALRAAGALREAVVDSSDDAAVVPFRDGSLATGASLMDVVRLLLAVLLPRRRGALPYEAIFVPRSYNGIPVPVARLARLVRRAGVTTHVWTVNDPNVAIRLWRAGVQGIISDDPGAMIEARSRV